MKKPLFCFMVLLLVAFDANAGGFCTKTHDHDLDLPCGVEETDYYLGIGLGQARPYSSSSTAVLDKTYRASDLLFGRRFSDHFAVEGAYAQLGSFFNMWASQTINVHIYSLTLLGKLPLDEDQYFSIYGRFGYASSVVTIVNVGHNWHGDWTGGFGAEYSLTRDRNWYVRAGIDQYNTGSLSVIVPGVDVPKDHINNYTATLLYNF